MTLYLIDQCVRLELNHTKFLIIDDTLARTVVAVSSNCGVEEKDIGTRNGCQEDSQKSQRGIGQEPATVFASSSGEKSCQSAFDLSLLEFAPMEDPEAVGSSQGRAQELMIVEALFQFLIAPIELALERIRLDGFLWCRSGGWGRGFQDRVDPACGRFEEQ